MPRFRPLDMIARVMRVVAAPAEGVRETSLLQWSRWALLATIAGLPTYVVRWHYGPIPTTLLESLIIVTVGLYAVARWRDGWRRPLSTPYDIPILLLLLAGAISVFVAKDHRGALGLYRAYFIEPVAVFYVAVDLLRRTSDIGRALLALAAGSSAFAILNLIVFAQTVANHQLVVGSPPSALYGDSNYVAMYLEPPVALAAGLVLFANSSRWRWLGVGWLVITGSALFVMFSKGTYVALAVLALVVVVSVRRWRLPLLGGFIAAALLAALLPPIQERFSTLYASYAGRIQLFTIAFRMLRESPVFGVGLGGYSHKLNGTTPELYPHDIWLTFWVEVGLLGMIAFAVILFGLLWRGWRAWPSTEGFDRAVLWGVLGALVLWTVHGVADSPYWKNDMSVEFWVLAAIEVVILAAMGARVSPPGALRAPTSPLRGEARPK
jgi:O-antigen ligase